MYVAGIPLQQIFFYSMPMERYWLWVTISNCHKFNILIVPRQSEYTEPKPKDIIFAWELLGWHQPLQLPIKNCANQDSIMKKTAGRKTFHFYVHQQLNTLEGGNNQCKSTGKPHWELPTAFIVHWATACIHQELLLLPLGYLLFFHTSAYGWTITSNNPKIHLAETALQQPSLMRDLSISNNEKHFQYATAGS